MSLKDKKRERKQMICLMAANIAGPLLATATTVGGRGLITELTKEEIDERVDIVAAYSLKCAMRINKLAAEKIK